MRRAFVALSVVWAALLVAAPLVASRSAASRAWYAGASLVYAAGSFICHQRPERSFDLWSVQMPVCARCTGIYCGGVLAAICAARVRGVRLQPDAAYVLVGSLMPSAATLVYEWATGDTPSNWMRALAGVPLGAAAAYLVVASTRSVQRKVN